MPIPDDAALAEWTLFLADLNAPNSTPEAAVLEKLKTLTISLCELLDENERAIETLTEQLRAGAQQAQRLEQQILEGTGERGCTQ